MAPRPRYRTVAPRLVSTSRLMICRRAPASGHDAGNTYGSLNQSRIVVLDGETKSTVSKHASGESIICAVSLASDHSAAPQTRSQPRSVASPFYISLDEPQALISSLPPP
ncbi:hypothetical protein EYF80_010579 [Liparis tanakae]|uniref:Uncharacterized protein n=1 Tax=Liparis tanakae TaxID=230148 RepID=A0A4Z2IMW4_9TELE|nr:hypothetical protein EYF80_010579 [Liparis tanakae]